MPTSSTKRVSGLTAALVLGWFASGNIAAADDAKKLPFPDITDTSHGTAKALKIFDEFFTAKSLHDGVTMVSFWAPDPVLYIDVTSGGIWPTRAALLKVWTNPPFSSGPPDALSYPLRIVGDEHSLILEMVDTPKLLGHDIRFLSAITLNDKGQIVRWMDYSDGRSSNSPGKQRPINLATYPTDFNDNVVNASATIQQVSQALADRFTLGDVAGAITLFTPDAVFEDMALHVRLDGAVQITHYLSRALNFLPYGPGATLAHVQGSDQGGGYEWKAAVSANPLQRGVSALELDESGKISRFTTVYDSSQLTDAAYRNLLLLTGEPTSN